MSRIGKLPVKIVDGVKVEVDNRLIKVSGPKGALEKVLPREISANVENGEIVVSAHGKSDKSKALHGTYRSLIANMTKGVTEGWSKALEMVGTGYRAETTGKKLTLTVGFSHPVIIDAPDGVTFKVEKNIITIDGIDKEAVGQVAAEIRSVRPPEPYKGKGIKYVGEFIRRKAGKAAKAAGAA
ncbi:50S ribosomal protein L6 [Candidatus Woesebacteria bacterium GWA1_41_8]|jgi:large subunit ribosomal protein L6|uniref:Large ribosomal subunit protein uL6 n=1 Tax=Candidatus Woesebacteria bacterium GWA1_41_8 TaxID=1802471 RepID=A0A1F7WK54_9BACT|nr:MAG: 50S ribosomal protein L6 [Candidatus Woesebacteria bacterium GWA1_41_8]